MDGRLVGGRALVRALGESERVFRAGSWDEGQVQGAGYNLRLADDLLVIPREPGAGDFTVVGEGALPVGEFTLAPGDSALVSTVERFCFDWDVTATIGPKFRWAARGLLVLQGATVHPGYGRAPNDDGEWVPVDNERLYFVIANVGPAPINMRRNDSIAYLQVYETETEPVEERRPVPNVGFDYLRERLFRTGQDGSAQSDVQGGLAYFRSVKDLQQEVLAETTRRDEEWTHLRQEVTSEITEVKQQVTEAQTTIERVNNTSDMIVVFGVFLVAVTLLGIVLTTLVNLISKVPDDMGTTKLIIISVLATVYAVSSVAGLVMVALAVRKAIRRS